MGEGDNVQLAVPPPPLQSSLSLCPWTWGPAEKKNEILLPADRQSRFDDVHRGLVWKLGGEKIREVARAI